MRVLKATWSLVLLAFVGFLLAPLPRVCAQCQRAKLTADDGAEEDLFGCSVAISADVALVGARWHSDLGYKYGAGYIFERSGSTWLQVAEIAPENDGGSVGRSVAIDGNFAVLGAKSAWTYVFERDPNGVWLQAGKLEPDDYTSGCLFGHAVSISGESVVVSAPNDDDNGAESGSAYVFERDPNGVWSQAAKLLADDGQVGDHFGYAVAIDGDVVVIGAPDDDDLGNWSGSAYVFEREPNRPWRQAAKLLPSDGGVFWSFGESVAVSGSRVLVGAMTAYTFAPAAGAAYIFERDPNGDWSEVAQIVSDDIANSDAFGASVALEGDVAVVGAWGDDDYGQQTGAAYVFVFEQGGGWSQVGKLLAEDGAAHDRFGNAVAVSGNSAVIGAYLDDDQGEDSGSAYVFAVGPDEDGDGTMDVCELPGTPTQAAKGSQGLGAGRQTPASKVLP